MINKSEIKSDYVIMFTYKNCLFYFQTENIKQSAGKRLRAPKSKKLILGSNENLASIAPEEISPRGKKNKI